MCFHRARLVSIFSVLIKAEQGTSSPGLCTAFSAISGDNSVSYSVWISDTPSPGVMLKDKGCGHFTSNPPRHLHDKKHRHGGKLYLSFNCASNISETATNWFQIHKYPQYVKVKCSNHFCDLHSLYKTINLEAMSPNLMPDSSVSQ